MFSTSDSLAPNLLTSDCSTAPEYAGNVANISAAVSASVMTNLNISCLHTAKGALLRMMYKETENREPVIAPMLFCLENLGRVDLCCTFLQRSVSYLDKANG